MLQNVPRSSTDRRLATTRYPPSFRDRAAAISVSAGRSAGAGRSPGTLAIALGVALSSSCLMGDLDDADLQDSIGEASGEPQTGRFFLGGLELELDYQLTGGRMIFEGDIVLDPEDAVMPGEIRPAHLLAVKSDSRLWPDGIVPYKIHRSVTTPKRVRNAMAEWEANTPIRFVPRTDEDAFVVFREYPDNTLCSAQVGYNGGRRIVYLADTAVRSACSRAIVTHEIGHILGFWHEHTRPDRDDHVNIIWKNVAIKSQFEIKTSGVRNVGPYDIKSTMHYRSYTLSSPRDKPSIKAKDGSLLLHNWATLSPKDIAATEALYGDSDSGGSPDAGPPEESAPDGGPPDGTTPDAGPDDGSTADAGSHDGSTADAGSHEPPRPDAGQTAGTSPDPTVQAGCTVAASGWPRHSQGGVLVLALGLLAVLPARWRRG